MAGLCLLADDNCPDGHFLWQVPQDIYMLSSIVTCPQESGIFFAGWAGWRIVAGVLRSVIITVFVISKNAMLYQRFVQLIQRSNDKTITGTSAGSHPCSILTRGGMFASVGVLIRDLTRNFVPLPLTRTGWNTSAGEQSAVIRLLRFYIHP